MSSETDERCAERHDLRVVQMFSPIRQWVECSCGWASPDLTFPTADEAIAWARKEHGLDA